MLERAHLLRAASRTACLLAFALAAAAAAQESPLPAQEFPPAGQQLPLPAPTTPPPPPLMGADDPSPAQPPREAPVETRPPEELVRPNMQRSVGVYAALNVGLLGLDVHQGRFYGFAAGNIGVPLLSNGSLGVFAIGAGISFLMAGNADSAWTFDLYGLALPGWQRNLYSFSNDNSPFVGFGLGFGFRYLHRSGFTLGFKAPIFGAAAGVVGSSSSFGSSSNTSSTIGAFFLGALVALPIVSFGYRF